MPKREKTKSFGYHLKKKREDKNDTFKITKLFKIALSQSKSKAFQKITNFPPQKLNEKRLFKIDKISEIINKIGIIPYIDYIIKKNTCLPKESKILIYQYLCNKSSKINLEKRKKVF